MKVEAISEKLVKPCTPTPPHLQNYKISFMDELNPTMNVTLILYYSNPPNPDQAIKHLEQSLAKILPQFYPFAGRYIAKHHLVDCADQGALFKVARADVHLDQLAAPGSRIDTEQLNDLLPLEVGEADEETDPILAIQATFFLCGGMSVGVSISHRVVDACSLGIFISAWSIASRPGDNLEVISPNFDGSSIFPGRNFTAPEFGTNRTRKNYLYNIVAKRFVFDTNAISRMRDSVAKANRNNNEHGPPSRVQLVSGLITNAMARISSKRQEWSSRPIMVCQAVNIRERTVPPLSKYSCGNLVHLAITEIAKNELKHMEFQDFVFKLSHDARRAVNECKQILSNGEDGKYHLMNTSQYASEKSLRSHEVNLVWLTDWNKFGFYEVELGWGKPVWVSVANVIVKNHVVLMNEKQGSGMEAWVQLQDDDMEYFEHDDQLRKFATNQVTRGRLY